MDPLNGTRVLLVIAGGIAAYKTLELIRRLRDRGASVTCVLTAAGARFVTPLSLSALSGQPVRQDLFDLTQESETGHIRLARESDMVVVAPATADIMARMAAGIADDMATTVLLATDRPVVVAPAMNPTMWDHPATRANLAVLKARGVRPVGPNAGAMAERDETGVGRMAEPAEILDALEAILALPRRLTGRRALVTSGPTLEAIDPVRYIANRSSGKQGHAIAVALSALGAQTLLVSGPTALADPPGVETVHVESARDMLTACEKALPVDVAVCAAAVADWRVAQPAAAKLKKTGNAPPPPLELELNPDILAALAAPGPRRPGLVVGFAAETEAVAKNAAKKLRSKGCDWIVANDVSAETGTFGGDDNTVTLVTVEGSESWPVLLKRGVAERLAARIADSLGTPP